MYWFSVFCFQFDIGSGGADIDFNFPDIIQNVVKVKMTPDLGDYSDISISDCLFNTGCPLD